MLPSVLFFSFLFFFFFNDTATTEIYTLSLHDALPIYRDPRQAAGCRSRRAPPSGEALTHRPGDPRSGEHTSELQSPFNLVYRLLLEKKKKVVLLILLSISRQPNHAEASISLHLLPLSN